MCACGLKTWALPLLAILMLGVARAENVETVTLCEIATDPQRYDHHLVRVTGTFFHGFEYFSISASTCQARHVRFWLEYGGSLGSETAFAGVPSSERYRKASLVVEDIPTALVRDAKFRRFDRIVHQRKAHSGQVTVIARYFSGDREQSGDDYWWGGYGHLFGFSLLVIQQVLAVKPLD